MKEYRSAKLKILDSSPPEVRYRCCDLHQKLQNMNLKNYVKIPTLYWVRGVITLYHINFALMTVH